MFPSTMGAGVSTPRNLGAKLHNFSGRCSNSSVKINEKCCVNVCIAVSTNGHGIKTKEEDWFHDC